MIDMSLLLLVVVGGLGVCGGQVFAHMTEQGIHDAVAMVDRNSDGHLSKSGNSYCLSHKSNPTTEHNITSPHNKTIHNKKTQCKITARLTR